MRDVEMKIPEDLTGDIVTVNIKCPACLNFTDITLDVEQLKQIQFGEELIQNILLDRTYAEREMFITGLCPACQDDFFQDGDV